MNTSPELRQTPVLIVGGGPVGLALAVELGWRGVPCVLVEQGDGNVKNPRANLIDSRTMEFCRRWGISQTVRATGVPADYPYTSVYATNLCGYEIARIDRAAAARKTRSPVTPEKPARCNQMWFDPILRDRASRFGCVSLHYNTRFETFEEKEDGVIAEIHDLATGTRERIFARYLVACCGGRSHIRQQLGIALEGEELLGHPIDILFRAPDFWSAHKMGKAVMYFLISGEGRWGPKGVWSTINALDGRELWRLTMHGSLTPMNMASLSPRTCLEAAVGTAFPHEVLSVTPWTRRQLVAVKYQASRVFLAGDCAHQHSPSGGYGMNTGVGDAVDLGWKLAAAFHGWAGPGLLESYDAERRPVGVRNVKAATWYHEVRVANDIGPIGEDTAKGSEIRQNFRDRILASIGTHFVSDSIALGYRYRSSICCAGDDDLPSDALEEFRPSACAGRRAPHAELADGRSILDLFGRGFVLLRMGENAPDAASLETAARARGVPLETAVVKQPDICALYERKLVLVRPDGHVAWRADAPAADPLALIDRIRGVPQRFDDPARGQAASSAL